MKYIKTFEHKITKKYWLVPTDDRFLKSLEKIKCDSKYIKILLSPRVRDRLAKYKKPFAFIGYNSFDADGLNTGWSWDKYEENILNQWYEERGYKFMGTVNMDYELEIIANKYNI